MRFLLLLAAVVAPACAQTMTPGLWEHALTLQGQAGAALAQVQQQLATMPAEQRRMVEEMMAKQGLALGGAGRLNTVRVCVSPAMAERTELPQVDGRCRQQRSSRSGDTVSFEFSCSGDPPASGRGSVTFLGSKAYRGTASVRTVVGGRPETVEMQLDGRFVGADCGALKPPA